MKERTMTPKEQRASEILAQYRKTLLPKWEGLKPFWHAWHADSKVYFMNYEGHDGYLDRIEQIEENKPEHERSVRFNLFKPVLNVPDGLNKANAEYDKAYAEWYKANAEWNKARAKWNKAYAEWDKAYAEWDKTRVEWNKANAELNKARVELNNARAEWGHTNDELNKACVEWDKARAEYRKLFTDELWMQECPEAVLLWSNERNELVFVK